LGFNLPLYARDWRFAPEAVGTDGLLDVCTFRRGSLLHGLRYLWHVVRGKHLQLDDARLNRGQSFRVEAADSADVAYQLDGDFGGVLPLDVEVLPAMLRLLVMPDVAQRLGFSLVEAL
jgi:diacylglycerol kinase family enzyme